jgi:hypothetical protein
MDVLQATKELDGFAAIYVHPGSQQCTLQCGNAGVHVGGNLRSFG